MYAIIYFFLVFVCHIWYLTLRDKHRSMIFVEKLGGGIFRLEQVKQHVVRLERKTRSHDLCRIRIYPLDSDITAKRIERQDSKQKNQLLLKAKGKNLAQFQMRLYIKMCKEESGKLCTLGWFNVGPSGEIVRTV